jgi:hypothetical protein
MKRVKRTTITFETERVFLVSKNLPQRFCPQCDAAVGLVRVEDAAKFGGLSLRALRRQIAEKKLHVTEEADGTILICFNSFMQ